MKLKDIFTDKKTKVFVVINSDNDNELNWTIEPTEYLLIPDEENLYFVSAIEISANGIIDCFIGIEINERIAEIVVKRNKSGKAIIESIYDQEYNIIPAIASECFGDYELYYAKENAQIGIDILKRGLPIATNKNVLGEDLGYILRDEGRIEEAIVAFKISEDNGPSSEYTYWELSSLYGELGQDDKQQEYKQKYLDNGGLEK